MSILLIVLIVILCLGGFSYPSWGSAYPAWGGGILWVLAVVLILVLVFRVGGGPRF